MKQIHSYLKRSFLLSNFKIDSTFVLNDNALIRSRLNLANFKFAAIVIHTHILQ